MTALTLNAQLRGDQAAIRLGPSGTFAFAPAQPASGHPDISFAQGGQVRGDRAAITLHAPSAPPIIVPSCAVTRADPAPSLPAPYIPVARAAAATPAPALQPVRARHRATGTLPQYHQQRARHRAAGTLLATNPVSARHRVTAALSLAARHRALATQAPLVSARHRALATQAPLVSARHRALATQAPLVSARHRALATQAPLVSARHRATGSLRENVTARHRATGSLLSNSPVSARHRARVMQITGDVRVLRPAPSLTHAGRQIDPERIELSHDTGQGLWLATINLGDLYDWSPMRIGDTLALEVSGVTFSLIIDQLQLDRPSQTYVVKALSPLARRGAPWLAPTALGESGMASHVCARLLGTPIDWQLVDWALPVAASDIEGTPLELARQITAAVGGVLQSNPDGSLRARPELPDASAAVAATLTDDDLVARSDAVGSAAIANRFVISSASAGRQAEIQVETIPHPDDPDNDHLRRVKAYPAPWRPITLAHTGDSATQITRQADDSETHEELIEIKRGTGQTRYPIAQVLGYSYQYANLGGVSANANQITTAVSDYSLLLLRYRADYRRWDTHNPRIETIQFLAMD